MPRCPSRSEGDAESQYRPIILLSNALILPQFPNKPPTELEHRRFGGICGQRGSGYLVDHLRCLSVRTDDKSRRDVMQPARVMPRSRWHGKAIRLLTNGPRYGIKRVGNNLAAHPAGPACQGLDRLGGVEERQPFTTQPSYRTTTAIPYEPKNGYSRWSSSTRRITARSSWFVETGRLYKVKRPILSGPHCAAIRMTASSLRKNPAPPSVGRSFRTTGPVEPRPWRHRLPLQHDSV